MNGRSIPAPQSPLSFHQRPARTIAITSWAPVLTGAGLEQWGSQNLESVAVTIWAIGIIMQLVAGYLHFIKKKP